MNILVLNLPFPRKIMRRYTCSAYMTGFCYPPHQLLRLATLIKQNHKGKTFFIDAIQEKRSLKDVIDFVKDNEVDLIFTLIGLDFVNTDLKSIMKLKRATSVPVISISYIVTLYRNLYPELEVVLDRTFEEKTYWALTKSNSVNQLVDKLKESESKDFPFNPNLIKRADRSLFSSDKYHEILSRGKTAFLYFGFGCPYNCNYCIPSYNNRKYFMRNKNHVFDELIELHKEGYKNVRILDDNCTIDNAFLRDLRDFIHRKRLGFNFYGLSRIDLITPKVAGLLREIGFKRLYLGLETLNPALQKYYNKDIPVDLPYLRGKVDLLKRNKIESGFWLIFNPLKETKKDLMKKIPTISRIGVDFINLSLLTPYPGTKLFNRERKHISFSPRPFSVSFRKTEDLEKEFFLRYYLRPLNALKLLLFSLKYPLQSLKLSLKLLLMKKLPLNRKDFI